MSKLVDISGQRFGKLIAKEYVGSKWECICDCGNACFVAARHIRHGAIKSCGCMQKENCGNLFRTHGHSKHPLMGVYNTMMQRCYNPNVKSYSNYGGRGITVYEPWHSFENFFNDMSNGYAVGLMLEREDNDGEYGPSNCRWATKNEQARNKRTSVFLEYNGERLTMADWAAKIGLSKKTLWARLNAGWPISEALSSPLKKNFKTSKIFISS